MMPLDPFTPTEVRDIVESETDRRVTRLIRAALRQQALIADMARARRNHPTSQVAAPPFLLTGSSGAAPGAACPPVPPPAPSTTDPEAP